MIVMIIEQGDNGEKMLCADERRLTLHFTQEKETFSLPPATLFKILNEGMKKIASEQGKYTRTILK